MNEVRRSAVPLVNDPAADKDLRRRVRLYLSHVGHRPVDALAVEAKDGIVTLKGEVPNFYARQLAIACARRVAGVRRVIDQVQTLPL